MVSNPDPRLSAEENEAFSREFADLAGKPPIWLCLPPVDAWILLSYLQLALRHPGTTGPTSEHMQNFARAVQTAVAPEGTTLAKLAELGWNSFYDTDVPKVPTCRHCGCTDAQACPGGCYWVKPDVCSRCANRKGEP